MTNSLLQVNEYAFKNAVFKWRNLYIVRIKGVKESQDHRFLLRGSENAIWYKMPRRMLGVESAAAVRKFGNSVISD